MTRGSAKPVESIQWQPAERLGQLPVDAHLRPWLIGKGVLTQRLKETCGARLQLRLLNQWTGLLSTAHQAALRCRDTAGLFRDEEMGCGENVWVFGETLIPDSTLSAHPWLGELGDATLGETLVGLSSVERGSYEYAWLPEHEAAAARALRGTQVRPHGLWARRTRVTLRNAPLLIQELFLPSMGRV